MTWRENLLAASFRGAPFEIEASEGDGLGRRKVVFEAPGRDEPFVQDLGAGTRRVRVEAFVVGRDYLARRDRLMAALRRVGAGELVHPTMGTLQATPLTARLVESNTELGMARFALEFVLDATETAVASVVDGPRSAAAASEMVQSSAAVAVALAGGPGVSNLELRRSRDVVAETSRSLADRVRDRIAALDVDLDGTTAAGLVRQLEELGDIALSDGNDFTTWLLGFQEGALGFASGLLSRRAALEELLAFARDLLIPSDGSPGLRVESAAAASSMAIAVEQAAEVGAGWESRSEALEVRDELIAVTDELLERVDDQVAEAVRDLRVAVVESVPDPAVELPELGTYTAAEIEPALVAASRLYDDPDRAQEIATRNGVVHPAFLPAGEPLEVLIGG